MTDPGLYLVNSTGEMTALLTESGDGDRKLLSEVLADVGGQCSCGRTLELEVNDE